MLILERTAARIIEPDSGALLVRFTPEQVQHLFRAVWSPSGDLIATIAETGISLWNPLSAERIRTLEVGARDIGRFVWSPDGSHIATIRHDGTLLVFDTSDGTKVSEIKAHSIRGSHQLEWAPSGAFVATGGADGLVRVWDTADWTLAHSLRGSSSTQTGLTPPGGQGPVVLQGLPVSALAFSPDSLHLASADDSVRLWNLSTGEESRRWFPDPEDSSYVPHYGTITDLEFDPNGAFLASAGLDQSGKVWDFRTGAQIANVDTFFGAVWLVRWSPDGTRLAMAGGDGAVVVWNVMAHEEHARFDGHRRGTVTSLDFALRAPRIVTSGRDGAVKVWYARNGALMFDLPPLDEGVSPLTSVPRPTEKVWYSPKSNRVLMLSDVASGRILEARTVSTVVGPAVWLGSQVSAAAWSPDGRRVAIGGYGARIVDVERLDATPVFLGHDGSGGEETIEHVAWSRDGRRVLTASEDGAVMWDSMTGSMLFAVNPREGSTYTEESVDGSLVLTVDGQFRFPRVQTWSLASEGEVAAFDKPGRRVVSACFLDGGLRVITTYYRDPVARVWDSSTGQELFVLEGHRARVSGVSVSPDGKMIATASRDGTVRLWDIEQGKELEVLGPRPGSLVGVKFSPDGRQVAAFGVGGAAVWELPPAI